MKRMACLLSLLLALPMAAQNVSPAPASAQASGPASTIAPADPWKALAFLKGTWEAKTTGTQVVSAGTYTFQTELADHIMARHSHSVAGCKGPADFDCDHSDLLYIYQEMPGQPLKAIYFDNEGHVIHYDVSTPSPTSALFLSQASTPGPRFRLTYDLQDKIMYGKFQMQAPGQTTWTSYLEWCGGKH